MKADIKRQWVKALRSGAYLQGKGKLRTGRKSFCCLGVLCDLHSKKTKESWINGSGMRAYLGCTGTLPLLVQRWAGLRRDNPNINRRSLASLNDTGKSFKTIASLIQKHL